MMLLLLSFATVVALGSAGITRDDCPTNVGDTFYLQVYGDSCFEFILYRQKTYNAAEQDCEERGGTLPKVNTPEINEFLQHHIWTTYFFRAAHDVWIGLHDKVDDNVFMWEDGTPLGNYANWIPNEGPLAHGATALADGCVAMDPSEHGMWRDHHCDENPNHLASISHAYICEFRVGNGTVAPPATTTTPVPTPDITTPEPTPPTTTPEPTPATTTPAPMTTGESTTPPTPAPPVSTPPPTAAYSAMLSDVPATTPPVADTTVA